MEYEQTLQRWYDCKNKDCGRKFPALDESFPEPTKETECWADLACPLCKKVTSYKFSDARKIVSEKDLKIFKKGRKYQTLTAQERQREEERIMALAKETDKIFPL